MPPRTQNKNKKTEHVDFVSKAEDIEKQIVSDRSDFLYQGRLINLMMRLFNNHPTKIDSAAKKEMQKLDRKDKSEETSSSSSSSSSAKKTKIQKVKTKISLCLLQRSTQKYCSLTKWLC